MNRFSRSSRPIPAAGWIPPGMLVFSFLFSIPALSGIQELGATFFQTNESYDGRIALDVDFVVVHQHGNPNVGKTIGSWEEKGYPTGRMFFIGSDAGRIYTEGKFDGKPHPDETEWDRDGNVFECAGVRPYMVPTEGWKNYVRKMAADSVDAGARVVLPEEPLAHTRAGYSPAFKRIWKERYGAEWSAPHLSPDAFFKAARLKSDLYYELVEAALLATKKRASERGKEVRFLLPTHSLLSHAAGRILYPIGRSLDLREKGLDGFVGQVWTGPIRWSMSRAEGEPMTGEDDFFASAYLLYSYFANLVRDTGLSCYLLADPVEDDPRYTWEEYRRWYSHSIVALSLFPWVREFEVMPWPDRVFLPGFRMASGTPAPEDYRRSLMNAFASLRRMAESVVSGTGGLGIGLVVADTLSWQMGGPEGASMGAVHGLTVPLIRRGIPVQVVPLERHGDHGFLDRFRMLILSYDAMKPLSASMNRDLAGWVKRGGKLLVIGGADLYNNVDEWWKREGYRTPLDALWEDLGVWSPKDERFFFRGPQEIRSAVTRFNIEGLDKIELPRRWTLTDYHFPEAEHLYTLVGKRSTPLCGVVASMEVGEGAVLFCGLPADWFAEFSSGGELVFQLLNELAETGDRTGRIVPEKTIQVRRGDLLFVHGCHGRERLKGAYVDVLDEDLTVLRDPVVEKGDSRLVLALENRLDPGDPSSRLLFSGPTAEILEESKTSIRLRLKSPQNTPVTLRLACRGRTDVRAVFHPHGNEESRPVGRKEYDSPSDTILLVVSAGPEGGVLDVEWRRAP